MSAWVDFYIFRHGETDWNAMKKCQGFTDIPLNEKGRQQAYELKKKMSNIPVDVVVTSDLKRAHETAQIVFENFSGEMVITQKLREICMGAVEGLTSDEIVQKIGQRKWDMYRSVNDGMNISFPEGESKKNHQKRVRGFLEQLVMESEHRKIAVSTHGGSLRRLINSCRNGHEIPAAVPNCALFHMRYKEGEWMWIPG